MGVEGVGDEEVGVEGVGVERVGDEAANTLTPHKESGRMMSMKEVVSKVR